MISATDNFTFEIKNSIVVENIFPGKKAYFFQKLVRSDGKEKFYYKKQY